MQKWIVLAAGVILQTLLGGVYAWSVFTPALTSDYGLSNAQCGLIFGVTIATFSVATVPAGRLLGVLGARILASIGVCLFATGYLVASLSQGHFPLLLLGIGIIAGVGIGTAYVCPLSVCMQWFPKHRGLVTGLAVAGFGGGAVLLSSAAKHLLHADTRNVLQVFQLIGIGYGAVALIAALLLCAPGSKTATSYAGKQQLAGSDGVLSLPFLLLCIGMFAGTFAGLLIAGNLTPLIEAAGFPGRIATLAISVFAFGNASGRIAWGHIHDRLNSHATILLSLGLLAIALLPLLFVMPTVIMLVAIWCCGCGFGACFVVYAMAVVQKFGIERFPCLYPVCFLGYGLAGLIAPGLGGSIADATGSYTAALTLSLVVVVAAMLIIALAAKVRVSMWATPQSSMADCLQS